jgi:hypothetical protein
MGNYRLIDWRELKDKPINKNHGSN